MNRIFSIALSIALVAVASPAIAGWPCSIDNAYPEVSGLRVDDGQLVAILGSHFATKEPTTRPDDSEGYISVHPQLSKAADGDWVVEPPKPYWSNQRSKSCMDAPVDPEGAWAAVHPGVPFEQDAASYFDQSILSCATNGNLLWGGISFYGGEGYWGSGGLAKKNTETGEVQYIRPLPLTFLQGSTGPIAHFADTLWMGTYWNGECGGPISGGGMKRLVQHDYYPDHPFVEDVPEVCGFAIRDFQEFNGALWVATELGLSKLVDDDGPKWTNFVPDLEDPNLFRELTCDELYTELLTSKEFAKIEGFDIGNAFDVFWERLSELRPAFTRQYMRDLHNHPPVVPIP